MGAVLHNLTCLHDQNPVCQAGKPNPVGGAKKIQDRIGMDSYVGTDYDVSGYRLSGGEKQRIGVSRAFMGDKQVLVLDEPAAMLDPIAFRPQSATISPGRSVKES